MKFDPEEMNLTISKVIWQIFHEKFLNQICEFVKNKLSESDMEDCNEIILFGGSSQSSFLQQRLCKELEKGIDEYDNRKYKIHFAPNPSWSVVIGGLQWVLYLLFVINFL